MTRTARWWHIRRHVKKLLSKRRQFIKDTKGKINPFWFKHECKQVRTYLHRASRRDNKIRLQKGLEIEKEINTNGWITY